VHQNVTLNVVGHRAVQGHPDWHHTRRKKLNKTVELNVRDILVENRKRRKMSIFNAQDALALLGLAAFNYMQFLTPRSDGNSNSWYNNNRPAWGPAGWIFGPAWFLLYAMTTITGYYFLKMVPADSWQLIAGFTLYTVHMAANKLWSVFFWGGTKSGPFYALLMLCLVMLPTGIAFIVIAAIDQFYLFAVPVALWAVYLAWLLYALTLNVYWVVCKLPTCTTIRKTN